MLHTAGLEKTFVTFCYSPLPPTHCHFAITNNTTTNMVQIFIPSKTEGEPTKGPFSPRFGQFLEHLHYQSFTGCLCKSTSQGFKNDFMINSQRVFKAIWSSVYYLESRKWGGVSRSTIQSNKMLKSFKSTSQFLAWGPKTEVQGEVWPKATEECTSPPSWPSCLCFAPEFAPNARLLLQPASPGRPGP